MTQSMASATERARPMTKEERKVILASSLGTVFEWYDFYLYGSLAAFIGAQFFTPFPETSRNIFALLAFAAGFIVRPFGALVFGMLGDMVGRKYTFLMTILIMGLSTFLVGILPGYASWGIAAPICLIGLRMFQGLALGGEYGGAAVYVAEHAPNGRRGFYTSWIQTTATLGLFLSLAVILIVTPIINNNFPAVVQLGLDGLPMLDAKGAEVTLPAWNSWGWRVPFILSAFLLLVSLYIRLTMSESPVYQKMKAEGAASKAPLREAFGTWKNGKIAIIALLGLTAGQAVVWYSGQFYALSFLQGAVKVDFFTANVFVLCSLVLGTWGFLFFGSLSDKIGRKPIILAGCAIAALTYFPVFQFITKTANPALHAAQQTQITVTADPADCSFQFNPVGTAKFTNSCDTLKALLLKASANSETVAAPAGTVASVKIGETEVSAFDGAANAADIATAKAAVDAAKAGIDAGLMTALTTAEKAAGVAKVTLADAEKALAGAADDAKAAAQTAVDAAKAAMPAVDGGLAAARAAVPADQLAALDAANASLATANGVKPAFEKAVNDALKAAGYPIVAADNTTVAKITTFGDLFTTQNLSVIIALTYLIILVTMVYGPIAAQLVELYPTRIRYSGMSLPYHIGNGWFGGLLPATVLAISAQYGNIYSGLWYPIIVAVMTVVIGTLFVPNGTHKKSIFAE
ncbi:MFS transporter [Rhodobacter sp. KR11]|uniref:MFS transporter n=1 Tax=Rhodobacter sp. KR11 TaxID=2974588 RepID=UPI002223C061|nr:MFS transporter [Rhodobacter sp. KR11]MCW1917572.1 MFS transporter [Rhodobacter sp. KR11]